MTRRLRARRGCNHHVHSAAATLAIATRTVGVEAWTVWRNAVDADVVLAWGMTSANVSSGPGGG